MYPFTHCSTVRHGTVGSGTVRRGLRRAVVAASLGVALSGVAGCGQGASQPAPTVAPRDVPPVTVTHRDAPVRQVGEPTHLTIPRIDVSEKLHGVGLTTSGAMETPDFGDAGWYDLGPRPGAAGPAVLVAHVHGPAGDDVFARLHQLRDGDQITVRRTDGASVFVVDSVERAKKESLPYDRIWNDTAEPVLRLITCGGKPDPVSRVYPDNTIVYAHLAP